MKFVQVLVACAAALLLTAAQGLAAPAAKQSAAKQTVDPAAVAALDKMAAALRSHEVFDLSAETTNEDVLQSGEKLQYAGKLRIVAQRPDRFRIQAVSDTRNREYIYDGKTVTIFSPKLGMYASFAAPPTIRATIEKARNDYDVELPLADLFAWGTDRASAEYLTSGVLVRPETIEGRSCNHYAFRQSGADWQIWIANDASALPCKLVITNRDDASMPQYTAVLRWTFPKTVADAAFTFTPPSGAKKIAIADVATMKAVRAKEKR